MRPWRVAGWVLWGLFLAAWTAALLSPEPPRASAAVVPSSMRFWVAKGLHLGAYAILAFAPRWLTSSRKAWWVVWLALVAHGALTEVGQLFVEGRHGSIRDVALDAAGVALGALAGFALGSIGREQR
jgi:VanZ family protein